MFLNNQLMTIVGQGCRLEANSPSASQEIPSPLIRKVTNFFKHANPNIAFRTSNSLYNGYKIESHRMQLAPAVYKNYSVKLATNRT
jgi:hypothetical protein